MTPFIYDADHMYGGALRRGDIVVAQRQNGEAYFVVVQDNILNDGLSTVMAIELEVLNKKRHNEVFPHEMRISKEESGLSGDVVAITHKMYPVDRRSIVAKTGELIPDRLRELYVCVDILFGRFRDEQI